VEGDLRGPASGSPAILTSLNDNSPFGGTDPSSPADWQGVTYGTGMTANLTNITIRHAKYGVAGAPAAVVGATFDRCYQALFVDSGTDGSANSRTQPLAVTGCTFLSSNFSTASAAPLTVSGCTFNASQLTVQGQTGDPDVSVTGNNFSNTGRAVFVGSLGQLAMSGNTSGDGNPASFQLGNSFPSGLSLSKNNTWNPQPGIHLINFNVVVRAGVTLNLGSGLVV